MPRSPEGVYSKPPGTNGGPPNSPISSTAYNSLMNDIAQDLNTPRPVVAGGVGANTAIGGIDNLHTASVPIPSSTTTDLSGATGISVLITGNTSIEEFGTANAGAIRVLTFEDDLTIVFDEADVKIIMPKAEDYEVRAGEVITFISEGAGVWRMVSTSQTSTQGGASEIIYEGSSLILPTSTPLSILDIASGFRWAEIQGEITNLSSGSNATALAFTIGDGTSWADTSSVPLNLAEWDSGQSNSRPFWASVHNLDEADMSLYLAIKRAAVTTVIDDSFFLRPSYTGYSGTYDGRPITSFRFSLASPTAKNAAIRHLRITGHR
jgi:hypothetical protein